MQVSLGLEDVADVVADQIHATVMPLLAEVKALSAELAASRAETAEVKALAADLAARLAAVPQPVDPAPLVADAVTRAVAEAVAQIPVPKDGQDADVLGVAEQVHATLWPAVDKAIDAAVRGHIATLPAPATAEDVTRMVQEAVAAIPAPKDGVDGRDGADGKEVDEEALIGRLTGHIERSIDLVSSDLQKRVEGTTAEFADQTEHRLRETLTDLVTEEVGRSVQLADVGIKDRVHQDVTALALELRGDLAREVVAKVTEARETLHGEIVNLAAAAATDALAEALPDEVLEARVAASVQRAIQELPPGPAGKDGRDGADADMTALSARVDGLVVEAVEKAVAALPPAKDGADGRDGADADMVALAARVDGLVVDAVQKAVSSIPVPKDGVDGRDGRDGASGIGAAAALIDKDGALVMTMTDGSVHRLGQVVGKSIDYYEIKAMVEDAMAAVPVPKDGKDGLGFDDLSVEFDGQRTITLAFTRGDQVKRFDLALPHMVYRGVWQKTAADYAKGDVVTWGGSAWVCAEPTEEQPGTGKGWTLAVKRGRDAGAPVVAKERPPIGPVKADP